MKSRTRWYGRTLLSAAVLAVGSVCWLGCGGDSGASPGHVHDWGDWVVTTPATCEVAGVETRTCKLDANHKETQTIPKLTAAGSSAGSKLKSTSGWYNDGNGTDQYGFSALPGGKRSSDGDFYSAGGHGYWWTATEYSDGDAYGRYMRYDIDRVNGYYDGKGYGLSARCVQD